MEGGSEGTGMRRWMGKDGREMIWGHTDGLSTAELFELHIWGGIQDSGSFTLIPLTQSHQSQDGVHLGRTKPPLTKSLAVFLLQPCDRIIQHVTLAFQEFTGISRVKYSSRCMGCICGVLLSWQYQTTSL